MLRIVPIFIEGGETTTMSGTIRSFGMKEQRRYGSGFGEDARAKMCQISLSQVLEYVRSIPDVRPDKVTAVRRRMDSGSWKPTGEALNATSSLVKAPSLP